MPSLNSRSLAWVVLAGLTLAAVVTVPVHVARAQMQMPPHGPGPMMPPGGYMQGPPAPAAPVPAAPGVAAPARVIPAPVAPVAPGAAVPVPVAPAAPGAAAPATLQRPAPASPAAPTLASDGRAKERVEADVSTRSVDVTSSFTGTEIVIFGSVEHSRQLTPESGLYDIAIVVEGTPTPIISRQKARVAGVWLNAQSVQFEKVPSYYAIMSTRPLEEIADPRTLSDNSIGFDSVRMAVASNQAQLTPDLLAEFKQSVVRLKQKDKLYQKRDYGVGFIGRSLFRSSLSLPANVPVGPLTTHVYLFKGGELLSKHSSTVAMQREGLERYMHDFAFKYPMFYGIFAVIIAVVSGLLASTLFKRGSH